MPIVLACVDLTESNDAMLACARSLAGPEGEIVILHVAPEVHDFLPVEASAGVIARELRQDHRDAQALADALRPSGVSVRALTVQGAIVERILDHAARLPADFIVLAARAHWAVHDLVVTSVLKGVIRRARVPVVVAPPAPPRAE
jgi:nucleotide-binding universal stress UspA family protein